MSDSDVLSIERDGHVATLWLDRPEARNAMGPAFWDDLPLGHDGAVRRPRPSAPSWWRPGARISASASTSRRWPGMLTGGAATATRRRQRGNGSARRTSPPWRHGR